MSIWGNLISGFAGVNATYAITDEGESSGGSTWGKRQLATRILYDGADNGPVGSGGFTVYLPEVIGYSQDSTITGTDYIRVSLFTDNAGSPGTKIGNFTHSGGVQEVRGTDTELWDSGYLHLPEFTFTSGTGIATGQNYWVVVFADATDVYVRHNSFTGKTNSESTSYTEDVWNTPDSSTNGFYAFISDEAPSTADELRMYQTSKMALTVQESSIKMYQASKMALTVQESSIKMYQASKMVLCSLKKLANNPVVWINHY